MRYWDSSALVALVVEQESSDAVRALIADDPQVLSWTLSEVELVSALCRLAREDAMPPSDLKEALSRLDALWEVVNPVSLIDGTKVRARRLLRTHDLRAADALQLGAAILAAYDDPTSWEFVCLDARLRDAAEREGFTVLPVSVSRCGESP